jgi:hypothetical protein
LASSSIRVDEVPKYTNKSGFNIPEWFELYNPDKGYFGKKIGRARKDIGWEK